MLFEFIFRVLAAQLIVLFAGVLSWGILSPKVRHSIAKHRKTLTAVLWSIVFLIVFAMSGFITALIVAFTTTFLTNLTLRFLNWLYQKEAVLPMTETPRFRSAGTYYQNEK